MTTHSSILAWDSVDRGAWQVQSTGSQRVGHDCRTKQQRHFTATWGQHFRESDPLLFHCAGPQEEPWAGSPAPGFYSHPFLKPARRAWATFHPTPDFTLSLSFLFCKMGRWRI